MQHAEPSSSPPNGDTNPSASDANGSAKLKKNLTLFDVYAICTGAMFSSGFFLLPGIAFAYAGPSVILAYLVAGVVILPALLSKAELATAMPKSGGTYFYLDRAFGPMVGTIGGLGTWAAMVLKTAFALIGIGAYLALLIQADTTMLALVLTGVFLVLNVVGAKESSFVQRVLVTALLVILGVVVACGLAITLGPSAKPAWSADTPFFKSGLAGLLSTIGLVFVSYAGLTKVASVAEEVQDPDRNIPLGMILSLLTATFVYAVGTYIMVALLPHESLAAPDLTPVASIAPLTLGWLPEGVGLLLVVVAAVAAFASTGNAGIMSASRYLLALARDERIPQTFGSIGRFQTPAMAVIASSAVIVVCILTLNVEAVAKLASAFQLMIFVLVNLSLIVMRESRLESYDPGYRSPLYPWMPIFGIIVPILLIVEMGTQAVYFTAGIVAACTVWYLVYARGATDRGAVVFHALARFLEWQMAALKRLYHGVDDLRTDGVEVELRGILAERGLRDQDPYDEVVARAFVLDATPEMTYADVLAEATELLAQRIPVEPKRIADELMAERPIGLPVGSGGALPHARFEEAEHPELVLVRSQSGVIVEGCGGVARRYQAVVFLVSPDGEATQHLRMLSHLALALESDSFLEDWNLASSDQRLRETLLRDDRFLLLRLTPGSAAEASLKGTYVRDIELPSCTLIASVRRGDDLLFPRGDTVLQSGDRMTLVGEPDGIRTVFDRYYPNEEVAAALGATGAPQPVEAQPQQPEPEPVAAAADAQQPQP